jgi:predicted enzyme related to lactoylglutathione lyase
MKMLVLAVPFLTVAAAQQPPPGDSTMPLSKASMIMLGVTDLNRSVVFYRDALGLTPQGQMEQFAFFDLGGVQLGLNAPLGKSVQPAAGATEVVFPVESVTAAFGQLKQRGCPFIVEPRAVNADSWAATLTDPDGHRLTIMGPR